MAHLHVNFHANGVEIKRAYDQVLNASADNNNIKLCHWAVFGYDKGTNDLLVQNTGSGSLDDLAEEFNDSQIQFAFCRVIDDDSRLPKFILINWCGDGVPVAKKALVSSHLIDIRQQLRGFHLEISARSADDLDPVEIIKKVKKSSGSKYSHQQTDLRLRKDIADDGPAVPGSAYKRPEIIKAVKPSPVISMANNNGNNNNQPQQVSAHYQPPEIPANIRSAKDRKAELEQRAISPISPTSSDGGWGDTARSTSRNGATEPPPIDEDPVKKLREERQRMDRELMERERRTSFKANIDSKAGRVAFNEGKNSNSVGSGAGADALVDPVMRIRLERERQEKELMERERRESQKREGNSPFAAAKAFATATATAANGAKSPVRAHGGTRTNNNAGDDVDSVRRIRMERERQEKELMERERRAADDRDRRQGAAAASNSIHSQPASSSRVAAALVNARRQSFERQQQQQQQEQTPVRERSSSFASAMAAAKAASESNQQQPAQQSAPVINQAYSAVHPAPAEAAAVIVEESPIVDVKIPVRKLASEDENGAEEESSDMWSDEGNKPAAGTNTANDPNYYRIEQSDVDNNQSVVNVNAVDLTKEQRQQQPLTETDIIVEEPQRQQQPLTETNIIVEESIIVDQQQSTAQQQIQSLCATALYDYDAAEANEMTLRTGDFIANIQQLDEAWWYGSVVAGDSVQRSGLFPANYVELIIMTATDADAAANKLPVEELVAEVEHQQHPMQVIEEQPQQQAPPEPQLYEQEPQQLLSVETAAIGEDSLITVRVLYDYEAADGSELTIRSGEIIFNVQQVSADWWSGQNEQGYIGLFPANYVELFQ